MVNHANEKSIGSAQLKRFLAEEYKYLYKDTDQVQLPDVKKALEGALERLKPRQSPA